MTTSAVRQSVSGGPGGGLSYDDRRPAKVIRSRVSAVLLAVTLFVTGCGYGTVQRTQRDLHGLTMGTTWSVKVIGARGQDVGTLRHRVQETLDQLEARMSTYREDSELSILNRSDETGWIPLTRELHEVLQSAWEISRASKGAFDATVGPLVDLWGFGPTDADRSPPSEQDIVAARKGVGFSRLRLRGDPPSVRKDIQALSVDLSAIAKGYAVDQIAAVLESEGFSEYLVEIGGELRGKGGNRAGGPWKIAIEKPDPGTREVYAIIDLNDVSVATSGGYRNFFEAHDGQTYSHTIDPFTGRPVTHDLASVTVVGPSAMRADANATALMVLGPDSGYAYALREGVEAFFVIRTGDGFRDIATPGFARYRVQPDT
ncbi:MAG: FAD:protein FMN transferase [Pseudomonadota bacterium]|nr:FAD:protein FMN transferase [Pseudomonadota bacterium]